MAPPGVLTAGEAHCVWNSPAVANVASRTGGSIHSDRSLLQWIHQSPRGCSYSHEGSGKMNLHVVLPQRRNVVRSRPVIDFERTLPHWILFLLLIHQRENERSLHLNLSWTQSSLYFANAEAGCREKQTIAHPLHVLCIVARRSHAPGFRCFL